MCTSFLSHTHTHTLSLYLSIYLSLYLSIYLSISLSLSLPLSHTHSCLSLYLYPLYISHCSFSLFLSFFLFFSLYLLFPLSISLSSLLYNVAYLTLITLFPPLSLLHISPSRPIFLNFTKRSQRTYFALHCPATDKICDHNLQSHWEE